jgi:glycosyltransferase involved in cell wall biosynthesis
LSALSKEGYDNLEYQLIGGGTGERLRQIAKKYNVEDKVKFLGSLSHDKVFEWMDDIDVYIQPSSVEGLCRSVIEAKSRACPVIASNAGGNPELVNNEYVFKKKNINQLKEKIVKLITNKNAMKDEAQRNFSDSKQYSKEALAKKREKFILEKLMAKKGDSV